MSPRPARRPPYRTSDKHYIRIHYRNDGAAAVARALGRSVASLYQFIKRHPELLKYPRR